MQTPIFNHYVLVTSAGNKENDKPLQEERDMSEENDIANDGGFLYTFYILCVSMDMDG